VVPLVPILILAALVWFVWRMTVGRVRPFPV